MSGVWVEVLRAGEVESVHAVDVAVVDPRGRLVAWAGDPERAVFARSAVKPFQALPLVEDGVIDRYRLNEEELALCCASHSGEPRHVEAARSILAKIGAAEDDLACGPHPPYDADAARRLTAEGVEPGRIHNNCSGKHAGMLALASAHGWSRSGYHEAGHPVQDRMLSELAAWSGVGESEIGTGVDGCGVVAFRLPLSGLALAFARLIEEAESGGSPAGRVVSAMTAHPFLVGGSGRLCTRLMQVTDGGVVPKVGAEGVYGAAVRGPSLGIALKARDGARRAAEPALVGILEALEAVGTRELRELSEWARPAVTNTRGEAAGEIRSRVELERAHG